MPIHRRRSLTQLAAWLLATYATAAIGALASIHARSFYLSLQRPPWAPPPWVFGPVWTVLYGLMAVAAWQVQLQSGTDRWRPALTLFAVQLTANALWSWLFFGWHLGALASVEVVVLWGLVLATVVAFWRIKSVAGVLLLPYLGWVTFAAALCTATWRLNPGLL